MNNEQKQQKRYRRHKRVRAKIKGTTKVPRLCVFRSANHIYAQLINDERGKTILSSSDLELKISKRNKFLASESKKEQVSCKREQKSKMQTRDKEEVSRTKKIAIAYGVGKLIAEKALKKGIKKVVFDRGGYRYHGRAKALSEGARDSGLEF